MLAKFAVLSKFCKCSNIETIGLRRIFQYDCGSKLSTRMLFTNCPTNAVIKVPLLNVSSIFCKRYTRLSIACNMSSRSCKEMLENAEKPRRPAQKHSKRLERRNKLKGLKTSHICCTQRSNFVPIAIENQPCLKIACNMSSSHKGDDKGQSKEVGDKGKISTLENKRKYLRKLRFKGIKRPQQMNCKRCKMNKLLKAAKTQNVLIKQNTDLGLKKDKANVLESTSNQDVSESQLPSKKVHVEFMESQNLKDFNINKRPQLPTVNNKTEQDKIKIEVKPIKPKAVQTTLVGAKKPIINLRTQNLKKSKNINGASKKPDVTAKTTTETDKSVAKESHLKDNYKNSKPLIATPVVNIISLARGIKLNLYMKLKSKTLPLKIKNKLNTFAMQHNFKKYKALASKALMGNVKVKEETISKNANKEAPKTLMENTKTKEEKVVSVSKNVKRTASKPLTEVKKEEATKETSENEPMNSPNSKVDYHKSNPSFEKPTITNPHLAEGKKPNLKFKSKKRLAKMKNNQKKLGNLQNHLEKYKILVSKTLIGSSKVKNENVSKDADGHDDKQKSKSLIDILMERNNPKLKSQSKTKLKLKSRTLISKLKKKTKKASKKFAPKTLMESNKDNKNTEVEAEAEKVESNPKIIDVKDQEINQPTFENNNLLLPAKTPLDKTIELKIPKKINTVKIFYRPHPRRIKMLMEQRKKLEQKLQMQLDIKEDPKTGKDLLFKNDVEPLPNIELAKNAETVKKIELPGNKETKGKTVLSDAISTLLNKANAPKMQIITNPTENIINNLGSRKKCLCGSDMSGTKSSADKPKSILLLSGKGEKVKVKKGKVDAGVRTPQPSKNKSETNEENILNNVTDSILNSSNDTKFKIIINPYENVVNNTNTSEQVNELPKKSSNTPSIGSNNIGVTSSVNKPESFLADKVNDKISKFESKSQIPLPIKKTINFKKAEPAKGSSSSKKVKLVPSIGIVFANNAATASKLEPPSTAEATTAKPQEMKKPANFHNDEGFVHISKDASGVLNELKEEKQSPIKDEPIKQSTFGKNYLTLPAKNSLDKSLELKVPKKANAIKIFDRPHPREIKILTEQRKKLEETSQTQLNPKEEPKTVKSTIHSSASDDNSESVPLKEDGTTVSTNRHVLNVVEVQAVAKDSSKKSELGSDISGTESDAFLKKYIKAEEVKYQILKAKVDAIMFQRMLKKNKQKKEGTKSLRMTKLSKSLRSRVGRNSNGSSKGDGSGERPQGQGSSKKASSSRFWNPLSLTLMPFLLGLTIYVLGNVGIVEMFKRMQNEKRSEEPLSRRLIPAYYKNNSTNKEFNLIETDSDENDEKDDNDTEA